jgi:feruloyl esterase
MSMAIRHAWISAIAILLANNAHASTNCSAERVAALRVSRISNIAAKPIAAEDGQPAHCLVEGSVVTKGQGTREGSAGFQMRLPEAWQHRFLFMGVGGNAGNFRPAVNAVDRLSALGKGYATIVTDTGHKGNGSDASWTVDSDGKPNAATRTDFFHRAAHDVTEAGKALAEAYYAGRIVHSYFDGCSTGGRMAMMEAERYPRDFDGIIAGDPAMDYRSQIGRIAMQKQLLSSPAAYLPQSVLPTIDKAIRAACDELDGIKDGLIQNPGQCHFKVETLLCKPGQSVDCLTAPQVATLHTYLSPLRDSAGRFIYPGMSPSDIAGAHGIQAWTTGLTAADFNHLDAPWGAEPQHSPSGWNYANQAIKFWLGFGPDARLDAFDVNPRTGVVGRASLKRLDAVFADAITRDPRALSAFVRQGRKMIMYHGFSDPAISPFRTTQFYREFAALQGGYARAKRSVRLFMAPGMDHCSYGPGPDRFDTLSAIEAWVEHGKAPDSLIATATDPDAVKRSMPLCPFPTAAAYRGAGDVNDAANWSCTQNEKLLKSGSHPRS